MVQAITGIPWYYRLFGYEMALDLGSERLFFWNRPGNAKTVEEETYRLRPATVGDIPLLTELYTIHCDGSLIQRLPDLTFLQLLFGYRSLGELDHARADCYVRNEEAAVLLNILFPKQHSWVVGLGQQTAHQT
jgi:hypothetical protein